MRYMAKSLPCATIDIASHEKSSANWKKLQTKPYLAMADPEIMWSIKEKTWEKVPEPTLNQKTL